MRTQNYSKKRQAIYELLMSTDTHPTADQIYNTLKPKYPDLSLGTVYRNLKVLEENGTVKSVAVVDGCERYDSRMTPHAHFICNKCGRVTDVCYSGEHSDITRNVMIDNACEVESYSLTFYGVCGKCLEAV